MVRRRWVKFNASFSRTGFVLHKAGCFMIPLYLGSFIVLIVWVQLYLCITLKPCAASQWQHADPSALSVPRRVVNLTTDLMSITFCGRRHTTPVNCSTPLLPHRPPVKDSCGLKYKMWDCLFFCGFTLTMCDDHKHVRHERGLRV